MARQILGDDCPPSLFEGDASQEMDFEMGSPGAYLAPHYSQYIQHVQQTFVDQDPYASHFQQSGYYPNINFEYSTQHLHQRHHSSSTQSTHSSFVRSSDGSAFSQWGPRSSVASTNTAYSQFSEISREQHIAQAERALDSRFSVTSPMPLMPIEEPLSPLSVKRTALRQTAQERDPFQSCRSGTKRSRPKKSQPTHWCTSCEEGFGEKYDWKRHEETYQERFEMFECELCNNIYFLDKDFIHHHQKSHRCQVCRQKQHVDLARRKRKARTGWGCGLCTHFSNDWKERCDHISWHFAEKGDTMDSWKHSQVIFSLLQRPEIQIQWSSLLTNQQRSLGMAGWNRSTTGRAEGYPDANPEPQLQDLLEFFTPDQDAGEIARLAFEKSIRKKELPQPPAPPPVPEKDHRQPAIEPLQFHIGQQPMQHSDTLQESVKDMISGNSMRIAVRDDYIQPTNLCPFGYDARHASFRHVPETFHSFR